MDSIFKMFGYLPEAELLAARAELMVARAKIQDLHELGLLTIVTMVAASLILIFRSRIAKILDPTATPEQPAEPPPAQPPATPIK